MSRVHPDAGRGWPELQQEQCPHPFVEEHTQTARDGYNEVGVMQVYRYTFRVCDLCGEVLSQFREEVRDLTTL